MTDGVNPFVLDRRVRGRLRPPCLVQHVPKCAGTSVVSYMMGAYPAEQTLTDPNVGDLVAAFRARRPVRGWLLAGHLDMDPVRALDFPFVSFVILRHPWQRLASRYHSLRRVSGAIGWQLLELPRAVSFDDWLEVLADRTLARRFSGPEELEGQYFFGEMIRYLIGDAAFGRLRRGEIAEEQVLAAAIAAIDWFDFVILQEDLTRSKALIDTALDIGGEQPIGAQNTSRDGDPGREYSFTPRQREILAFLCRLELPAYEHALGRFRSFFG